MSKDKSELVILYASEKYVLNFLKTRNNTEENECSYCHYFKHGLKEMHVLIQLEQV